MAEHRVSVKGDEPHEGDEHEEHELEHEDGDEENEEHEDEEESETTWRLMLSEVKDEVTKLQNEVKQQAAKATEYQATLKQVLMTNERLRAQLKSSGTMKASDPQTSPPAPTRPPQAPAPSSEVTSANQGDPKATDQPKPASPKFKKVLLHRRSI